MTQIHVNTETALRETMIENEWRKSRVMILAQQLADAQAEISQLREQVARLESHAAEVAEREQY